MKIFCVGLNYPNHAEEIGMERPAEPVIFMKPDTALLRDNQPFYVPDWAERFDYELELVFRVCRLGRHIEKRFAHRYYDAVGLGIDFTARDLQQKLVAQGKPWELSKGFDYSAAISKFIPLSELGIDPQQQRKGINFSLSLNGEQRQVGCSDDMLFDVDDIIAYVSRYCSLRIGDLIFTGTPVGVGAVKEGDRITAQLNGLTLMDFKIS